MQAFMNQSSSSFTSSYNCLISFLKNKKQKRENLKLDELRKLGKNKKN